LEGSDVSTPPESAERSPYRSDAHRTLAEREATILTAHEADGLDAQFAAIAADRAARWAVLLAGREESADLRGWAVQMTIVHGPQVRLHRNTLDWITALYVAKYGEAEDFWPPQLTDDDARRAGRWLRGESFEGVTYLAVEG
jgi:hypothetical protein